MEWSEREKQIKERLDGPLSPARDFGWAVAALRDAMMQIKHLLAAANREQEAKVPARKERKT